jgi:hypothetical protein
MAQTVNFVHQGEPSTCDHREIRNPVFIRGLGAIRGSCPIPVRRAADDGAWDDLNRPEWDLLRFSRSFDEDGPTPAPSGRESLGKRAPSCRSPARRHRECGRAQLPANLTAMNAPCPLPFAYDKAEDCIRSAGGKASLTRRAMAALRIQCFELNRADSPGYGDSIQGETFGGLAPDGKPWLPVGARRRPMTSASQLRTHERSFQGVWARRSGSAGRESTITSKGGLDDGEPRVTSSRG